MLDFVPNHSAVDADWTMSHPEYYVRAPQGSHPPYDPNTYYTNGIAYGSAGWGGPWMDTSQYNYWKCVMYFYIAETARLISVLQP
jgi:hypothetical protein